MRRAHEYGCECVTCKPAAFVVLVTVGFQGSTRRKPGQLVKATIVFAGGGGEEPVGFQGEGKYVNDRADAKLKRRSWKIIRRSISPGDCVRFDVFTGVRGAGEDAELTGTWVYILEPGAPVQEVRVSGVGPTDYPLAKGRLVEMAVTTKREQHVDDLEQYVADESGM